MNANSKIIIIALVAGVCFALAVASTTVALINWRNVRQCREVIKRYRIAERNAAETVREFTEGLRNSLDREKGTIAELRETIRAIRIQVEKMESRLPDSWYNSASDSDRNNSNRVGNN